MILSDDPMSFPGHPPQFVHGLGPLHGIHRIRGHATLGMAGRMAMAGRKRGP